MKKITLITILLAAAFTAHAQNTSVYTDLIDTKCRTVELNADEGGSYLGECKGVGGYKLQVLEGDLRQSVNVIDSKGKKTELNLWRIGGGGFSSLGEKAEWRMRGKTPVALIVRYNVSIDPEDATKTMSYLVVVKLAKNNICVTEALKPTRSHNMEARRAADKSATRPCRNLDT